MAATRNESAGKATEDKNHQKIKLLKLMEILRQETDENHPMLTSEICDRLGRIGISCERRTVGKDVKLLREQGFEIMSELKGHQNAYWISDRSFEIPELKVLVDAVQAASFIPESKSRVLIDKIAALGGSHQAELLKDNIICFNTRKHSNNEIFYTIDALTKAVQQKRKVSFSYFDLDENRKKVYRREGERYIVSPHALVFSEDNYYLLGYSEIHEDMTTYRLDRMDHVQMEKEESDSVENCSPQDIGSYTEQVFHMYKGELQRITIRFSNSLIGPVYDKFGENIVIHRVDEDCCEAEVDVQVSPTFWGWIFQLSDSLMITAPQELAEEYKEKLKFFLDKYPE